MRTSKTGKVYSAGKGAKRIIKDANYYDDKIEHYEDKYPSLVLDPFSSQVNDVIDKLDSKKYKFKVVNVEDLWDNEKKQDRLDVKLLKLKKEGWNIELEEDESDSFYAVLLKKK